MYYTIHVFLISYSESPEKSRLVRSEIVPVLNIGRTIAAEATAKTPLHDQDRVFASSGHLEYVFKGKLSVAQNARMRITSPNISKKTWTALPKLAGSVLIVVLNLASSFAPRRSYISP